MSDLLLEATGFKISSILKEGSQIEIVLHRQGARRKLLLENVLDYRDFRETDEDNSLSQIRVDDGKTSYAWTLLYG